MMGMPNIDKELGHFKEKMNQLDRIVEQMDELIDLQRQQMGLEPK